MDELQALLDQYAANALSAIESTDDQFATAITQHDRTMAKHRENLRRYATPQPYTPQVTSISAKHGDRAYSCTNAEVIVAAKQKRPDTPDLLHQWLRSEFGVYILPDQIKYEAHHA